MLLRAGSQLNVLSLPRTVRIPTSGMDPLLLISLAANESRMAFIYRVKGA